VTERRRRSGRCSTPAADGFERAGANNGLDRIAARVGGRSGTFVLQRTGKYEHRQANESYSVIAGSGTDELRGLHGEGTSSLGHEAPYPYMLDYDL
jgi:hypothetical protein